MVDLDEDCGLCHHPFALHWLTHNRGEQGCVARNVGMAEEGCSCTAFMVPWRPEHERPGRPTPAAFVYQGGPRAVPEGALPRAEDVTWEPQP
jgi:hypothetical protein